MSRCRRIPSKNPIVSQRRLIPYIVIGWWGMFTKRLPSILYECAIANGNGSLSAVLYTLNVVPTGTMAIPWFNVTTRVSPALFLIVTNWQNGA